jgi:hypothetical protein
VPRVLRGCTVGLCLGQGLDLVTLLPLLLDKDRAWLLLLLLLCCLLLPSGVPSGCCQAGLKGCTVCPLRHHWLCILRLERMLFYL